MAQTTRTRSPRASLRRAVLADLKHLKSWVNFMYQRWDVSGQVYDPAADSLSHLRPRRVEEYPEMSAKEWGHLADYAWALEKLARDLKDAALLEVEKLTAEKRETNQED